MNPSLAQFSDWVLALLPRLFLYPGGLWALGALVLLAFVSQGSSGLRALATRAALSPLANLRTALAWAALSLLDLPGAAPLPLPAGRLVLAALLVLSSALGRHPAAGAGAVAAVTLAVLAPLGSGRALIESPEGWGVAGWLSLAAVGAGLLALAGSWRSDLAHYLRLSAWAGLALAPVWPLLPEGSGPFGVSAVFAAWLVMTGVLVRAGLAAAARGLLVTIAWALAGFALLSALLEAAR